MIFLPHSVEDELNEKIKMADRSIKKLRDDMVCIPHTAVLYIDSVCVHCILGAVY